MEKSRHQWLEIGEAIGPRSKNDDGQRQIRGALLKRQVAIHGHENIEPAGRLPQKVAVANAGPAELVNGGYIVAANVAGKPTIDALV